MGGMCSSQRNLEAGSTVKSPGATAGGSPFAVDDILIIIKKFALRAAAGKKVRLSVGDKLKVTEVGQFAAKVNLEGGDWEEPLWLYKKDHAKVKNTAVQVGDILQLKKKKATLRGQGVAKKLVKGDKVKVTEIQENTYKVNGVDNDWDGDCWLYKKDFKKFEPYEEPEQVLEEAPVVVEETTVVEVEEPKPVAEVEEEPVLAEDLAPVVATEAVEEAPKAEATEVATEETQAETA